MTVAHTFNPGQRVVHPEWGEGVVLDHQANGYVRAFFGTGERLVPGDGLSLLQSREERILRGVSSEPGRSNRLWLAFEAATLPYMESAAALTAAKIDLLPHQVVMTHRVAVTNPRRYLVADEVGLGKTIETALVLRELATRGELTRALMVVPAGLVNNWHRELNEVFNLQFEVFGSEGDVTDRKSNAFMKHDRLIASVDTLKRPSRIKRLLEAPKWDLVVFDEAHHLTAYRNGGKVTKTENYKLAEALRGHSRDLLLLSATPHQGDHFRFWKLIQLLNPGLFVGPEDMLENRHRLNEVVIRRTKADACRPDGSTLFAKRLVSTESFVMGDEERRFYSQLNEYLEDGFALAKRSGKEGRALGFVMTVFQKIAASSFQAVRRTLRRRLLMLTIHEAVLKDQALDIDGREKLLAEAKELIHEEYELPHDAMGRGQVDRSLAELRYKTLKKLDDEQMSSVVDSFTDEAQLANAEELASNAVSLALPEERSRISVLMDKFPKTRETKVASLIRALGALWKQNPAEKVVIFATYLGTVDLLGREINSAFPDQGVVVLRGGDHGAKLAAEKRFKNPSGPKVMVCTAAGREGINLQFSRVLINFDLPWNPMDMEQRIGRIHRYGQKHTAQVYNLVLSDTIEGKIFLLLDSKLQEIARTLGKLDAQGNVAEDLRSQILGQLAERLNYDRLYQEALSDPELKRTKVELEAALSNADQAQKVVFELFQDLDGFSLEDYLPFADARKGLERIVQFLQSSLDEAGNRKLIRTSPDTLEVRASDGQLIQGFTMDRDTAQEQEALDLLGLDHPLVQVEVNKQRNLAPEELGISVEGPSSGTVTAWLIEATTPKGEVKVSVQALAVSPDGKRQPLLERRLQELLKAPSAASIRSFESRQTLLREFLEPMLHREIEHRGAVDSGGSFKATMLAWIEVVQL
jgi:SNF2 family DNA or RNA helicase